MSLINPVGPSGSHAKRAPLSTLLWFIPPTVVMACGVWASLSSPAALNSVTGAARDWADTRAANAGTLAGTEVGDLGMGLVSDTDKTGFYLSGTDRYLVAAGDTLSRPISLTNDTGSDLAALNMETDAAEDNALTRALTAGLKACDVAWQKDPAGAVPYVCPDGSDEVRVGAVRIVNNSVAALDGPLKAGAETHLLITFAVAESTKNVAAGQEADLHIRFIGA